MKYKVEMCYTYGWDDAQWRLNDKPQRFASVAKAEAEIQDHLKNCRVAVKRGDMDFRHHRSEFRIVPATRGKAPRFFFTGSKSKSK